MDSITVSHGSGVPQDETWKSINAPFPPKTTRQCRKTMPVKENGVITHHLKNLTSLSTAVTPLRNTDHAVITPVCLYRDTMAIKPSGDFDYLPTPLLDSKTLSTYHM